MSDQVSHTLLKNGEYTLNVSDLQFDDQGVPYVVLEWLSVDGMPDNMTPLVRVRLDPKHLHKGNFDTANYLYDLPVAWPE
jgi:hypothetical protein